MPRPTPKGSRTKRIETRKSVQEERHYYSGLLYVTVTLVVLLILSRWGLDLWLALITLVVVLTYRFSSHHAFRGMMLELVREARKWKPLR